MLLAVETPWRPPVYAFLTSYIYRVLTRFPRSVRVLHLTVTSLSSQLISHSSTLIVRIVAVSLVDVERRHLAAARGHALILSIHVVKQAVHPDLPGREFTKWS